ncbi:hypothetical protein [Methylotenera sp.]|uniref:hypothetical protein n=1 Tax=Methylotenera sp. TaxID=2051956 RepID=UPI002ED988B5
MNQELIAWAGSVTASVGSLLLALNIRYSNWGWVLFLISNIFWIVYSLAENQSPICLQNSIFIGTSLLGIYRWIFSKHSINN